MNLLNGHTEARTRSSEGCTVLACGCAHTDLEYVQMCGEHFEAWHTRHVAAAVDHTYLEVSA